MGAAFPATPMCRPSVVVPGPAPVRVACGETRRDAIAGATHTGPSVPVNLLVVAGQSRSVWSMSSFGPCVAHLGDAISGTARAGGWAVSPPSLGRAVIAPHMLVFHSGSLRSMGAWIEP